METEVEATMLSLDTCPRLKSTERTSAGNLEAAEPIRSEAGMALEAVLALEAVVASEVVVDAL